MRNDVEVVNLATGEVRVYSGIAPEQAVIAAYAQERGDWNTWNYSTKYKGVLEVGKLCVLAGDWSAFKDGKGPSKNG